MKNLIKKTFIIFLSLIVLASSVPALAEDEKTADVDDSGDQSLIGLTELIDNYFEENHLSSENISVGIYRTDTGEEYYYNGDKFYYSASLFKVPLMMQYAEKVYNGELDQDGNAGAMKLSWLETTVLTYSSNDNAHYAMDLLGAETQVRENYKKYAPALPDDYYPNNFDYSSEFSARFMTNVMMTLYNNQEQFPNIIDCLLVAQPEGYFRLTEGQYDIAQKYGSYEGFQHNTGIIYTSPAPIILTIMSRYLGNYNKVISELCYICTEYAVSVMNHEETLRLRQEIIDKKAAAKKEAEEEAAAEAAAAEAQAQKEAEEAAKLEAQENAEAERKNALAAVAAAEATEKAIMTAMVISSVCGAVIIVACTVKLISSKKKSSKNNITPKKEKKTRYKGKH